VNFYVWKAHEALALAIFLGHNSIHGRDAMHKVACGCSSGVEHNLAKVGVEGSNPFARSITFSKKINAL
jgi:hypothetical protein